MKVLRHLAPLASALVLSLSVSAQDTCATLTLSTTAGPRDAVRVLTVSVTQAPPMSPTWLAVGRSEGETTIDLGDQGTILLGIDQPRFLALGRTDQEGNLTRSYLVPAELDLTLLAQTISATLERGERGRPQLRFCTSDVAAIDL